MEWSDVRIFLAVVRGGSFGEAARTLGVSHPTVGRRIKALEDEAQQALFRRTRDGLVLTDAGDGVLALAESMENSALAMERRLAGNHERLEGMLRISSAEWFAGYVLAPVLAELTRRHPAVVPEVIASYRLLDLSRREADVAFRLVPFSEPDIVQRRLMSMAYGVYGSAGTASALHSDPASVGLVLMNTAQSHFPDVAWLLDRFPLSRRVFTSTSRALQAQMCLQCPCLAGTDVPARHGHCSAAEAAWRCAIWLAAHRHAGPTPGQGYLGRLPPRPAAYGSPAGDAGYRRYDAVGYPIVTR
ncbi:LysR family transcriptional regulator [Massilia timonae]|uniref:Bacterial regulatory helix-turn-helix, lysR family protein n=1 Tax=Massilia timonae TaxID=47229 RepID=A0A1S2N3I4_9BURK|nr:bacterial regulatory helix-turn-helix, lysR family protein [Massilia timonae]